MNKLTGQVMYITGGTKGIGYGIAEAAIRMGIHVIITGRGEVQAQQAAQNLLDIGPGKALGMAADVRDLKAQESAVQQGLETFGKIDVVVANAGLGHFASIEDLSPSQWQETMDVNLTGVFNTIKSTIPSLKTTKGLIITIASLAGTNFFAKGAAYNASKFGLVGFTQAVMLDLRQYGIRTTTIMPGSVATYFNNHVPSDQDAWKIQPEDIGQMVLDLMRMPSRTLPSKIEVRPSMPPKR